MLWTITGTCSNPGFLLGRWTNYQFPRNRIRIFPHGPFSLKVMQRNAWKCIANRRTKQLLHKVATPCIDDHQFKEEEMVSVGDFSKVCSQIVLECPYLARIGRLDILWSVNKFACAITIWTKACDKRLARLISYIYHTRELRQYCHVGNTAKQC